MDSITLKSILLIIQRTINSVDDRLVNHGEQVGFICLRMGMKMGYSEEQLLALCAHAMIHDIGAYKVEERRRIVEFEAVNPHNHAVYGALFVKHFGPFQHAASTILYHHWKYEHRHKIVGDHLIPSEAFLLHLADRVSMLYFASSAHLMDAVLKQIPPRAGKSFDPDHVTLLIELIRNTDIIERIQDGSYLTEFYTFLDKAVVSQDEAISYMSALVYIIEFRSRQTVTHSVSVASAATQIAEVLGLPEHRIGPLRHAALLHDVGKITTPLDILTKPGKLTESEMDIMRQHVTSTADILKDTGLEEVRELARNHHERLNGGGYPRGLNEEELCTESRILAVADILSALVEPRYYKQALSKEDVLNIMGKAASAKNIDPELFTLVQDNYEQITNKVKIQQNEMLSLYEKIAQYYDDLLQECRAVMESMAAKELSKSKAA